MSKVDKIVERQLSEVSDYAVPEYVFQTMDSILLKNIALGKVDTKRVAAGELSNRGLDKNLKWVGFDQAEKIWRV